MMADISSETLILRGPPTTGQSTPMALRLSRSR
jgi:hypothetical protein